MEQLRRQRPDGVDIYEYYSGSHIIIKYNDKVRQKHGGALEAMLGKFDDILQSLSGEHELVFVKAGIRQERKGALEEVALSFRGKRVAAILTKYDKNDNSYRLRRFEEVRADAFAEEDAYKKELVGHVAFLSEKEDAMRYLVDKNLATKDIVTSLETLRREIFALPEPFRVVEANRMRKVWQAYIKGEQALLQDKRVPLVVKSVRYDDKNKDRLAHVQVDLDKNTSLEKLEEFLDYSGRSIKSHDDRIDVSFSEYTCLSDQTMGNIESWCKEYHYTFGAVRHRLVCEIELSGYEDILAKAKGTLGEELNACGISHHWEVDTQERLYIVDNSSPELLEQVIQRAELSDEVELKREIPSVELPIRQVSIPNHIEERIKNWDRFCKINFTQGYLVVTASRPLSPEKLAEEDGIRLIGLQGVYTLSDAAIKLEGLDAGIKLDEKNPRQWIASLLPERMKKSSYYYSIIKKQDSGVKSEYHYRFAVDVKNELQQLRLKYYSKDIDVQVPSSSVVLRPRNAQDYSNILRELQMELPKHFELDTQSSLGYHEYYCLFLSASLERKQEGKWNKLNNALVSLREREGVDIRSDKERRSIRIELPFIDDDDRDSLQVQISKLREGLEFSSEVELHWANRLGETRFTLSYDREAAEEYNKQLQTDSKGQEVSLEETDEETEKRYSRKIGKCLRRSMSELTIKLDDVATELKKGDTLSFQFVGEATNIDRQLAAMSSISGDSYQTTRGAYRKPMRLANPKLKDFIFDPRCAEPIDFSDSGIEGINSLEDAARYVKETAIEASINQKQCEAVARALWAKDISIIQGPPGTGKTTVIAEMINQEIKRNPECRILLTSQTNLAVDNALERLKGKANIRPIRIMREDKSQRSDGAIYMENIMSAWVNGDDTTDCILSHWIEKIHGKCADGSLYADYQSELEPYLSSLRACDASLRKDFFDRYRKGVNLIAATCSICGNEKMFKDTCRELYGQGGKEDVSFDVVIIDEASKATPLELAIPMVLGKKIVLIGDHKQLPAMLSREDALRALERTRKESYQEDIQLMLNNPQFKSMFEAAQSFQPSILSSLDTQYRMHKDIMHTVSHIYKDDIEGGLKCGIEQGMDNPDIAGDRASRYHGLTNEPLLSPEQHAVWVDSNSPETKEGTSFKNEGEVRAIEQILNRLESSDGFDKYQGTRRTREEQEIAVITFYGAQAGALERHLKGKFPNLKLRVDVVDNFQGMERDIVLVSTVRSNNKGNLGFARELERINVAFSRARRLLIVVGNKDLFERNDVYRTSISNMHKVSSKML